MRIARAVLLSCALVHPPLALAAPCAGFTDVDTSSPFCANVAWMKNRGITLGCTATLYCPDEFVTRLQMAAFLYRLGFQNAFLQGGNSFGATAIVGTDDNQPLEMHVNGTRAMRYEPRAISPNVIGGSAASNVTAGVRGASIGGGGAFINTDPDVDFENANQVTDIYGTVAGGYANRAGDDSGTAVDRPAATVGGGSLNVAAGHWSTVSGGDNNRVDGGYSAVAGGIFNRANGQESTVGGGFQNTAGGASSTVAGGALNQANGQGSMVAGGLANTATGRATLAAGESAIANADGCLLYVAWASHQSGTCNYANIARFIVDRGLLVDYFQRRPDGGGERWVHIGDLFPGQAIRASNNAHLTDAGVWVDGSSSREAKTDFAPVDSRAILDKVATLPITSWRYRDGERGVRHIGPMAEDFTVAFEVGYGPHTIADLDARGVAFAAIQGLNEKVEQRLAAKDAEIAALRADLAALRSALATTSAARPARAPEVAP